MRLERIYRHPIKSIGAERLQSAALVAGRAMPGDRAFAVTHAKSAFDPAAPAWAHCSNFLRVANAPGLAAIEVSFDLETSRLDARHPSQGEVSADVSTDAGRATLIDWIAPLVEDVIPGPHALASVPERALTDYDEESISIMSLASLRDLAERMDAPLDPRRFRGNAWIDGEAAELAPWAENGWIGRDIGIGATRLTITGSIVRCMATAANPETGLRDVFPTKTLARMGDDPLFGVTAVVKSGDGIAVGDAVALL